MSCPAGKHCKYANGATSCVDDTAPPPTLGACNTRSTCGECNYGQVEGAARTCSWCPTADGSSGFCYNADTDAVFLDSKNRCGATGQALIERPGMCPQNWCANFQCSDDKRCVNRLTTAECVSKCLGFTCEGTLRCVVDGVTKQPKCVDACASTTCLDGNICTINAYGQPVCVDKCQNRCTGAATCTAATAKCTCPAGKEPLLLADSNLIDCRDVVRSFALASCQSLL